MEYKRCQAQSCDLYAMLDKEYCYMHYATVLTVDDYKNAIDAYSACNVSGLIGVMNEVKDRIWVTDRKYGIGTYFVNHHPIIQLYAYQIAYLSHGREPIEWGGFSDAYKFCKAVVAGEILPDSNWMISINACYHTTCYDREEGKCEQ